MGPLKPPPPNSVIFAARSANDLHSFLFFSFANVYERILWLATFANSQGRMGASEGKLNAIFVIFYKNSKNIGRMIEGTNDTAGLF